MKKWICLLLLPVLLTGCGAVETFETLGDVPHVSPGPGQLRQVVLQLPEDAALETANTEDGITVYSCDGYDIILQHFSSGNLTATVKTLSGFEPAQLTMVESACGDHDRYDWVWTAISEEGEMVCRGAVLDDGAHHYALCVIAPSQQARQVQSQWNALFASFCLETQ